MGVSMLLQIKFKATLLRPLFVGVVLLIAFHGGRAQDFKRQYKNSKDFFKEGKYNLAMESFKPVMVYDKNNPYAEYASFYYAQAALRQNFSAVAKDMLLQIRRLYPNWDQMNEVNYWLAKIYFDKGEWFQGMHILSEIRQEDYLETEEIGRLKRHHLSLVSDPEVMRMMWEEYPNDQDVGKFLAAAIGRQPYDKQDRVLFDSVVTRFGLDPRKYTAATVPMPVFKDSYTVSVLFPFLASTLDASPSIKQNQLVLDLYEGMRIACDSLFRKGIKIDLWVYDTERNPSDPDRGKEAMKKLLGSEELKNTDLIVGPIFREELKPVQQFSEERWINMINPVSNNAEYIGQNPYAMLFQPSLETLGARSADMLAARGKKKNCMVLYGDSQKDSVMAANFSRRAQELGLQIVWSEQFKKETAERIIAILAKPTEFDEFKNPKQFTMKLDSIGSVYVASDNPLIYTKVISSIESRGDSVLIIGSESWLDNPSVDLRKYERLNVMFAAPNYTPYFLPPFLNFRKAFIKTHGYFPQEYMNYTKVGFEFMMIVGRALHNHGVYFQEGLYKGGMISGFLTTGYEYSQARDNQGFPFIYFLNGQLVPVK